MNILHKIGIGFAALGVIIFIIGCMCEAPDVGEYGNGEYVFSLRNTLQAIGFSMAFFSLLFFSPPT